LAKSVPPSAEQTSATSETWLPRAVKIGPITLDLFHRDGLVGDCWVGFHPREFEVLWRLAETPDILVTRGRLLKDVWRLDHDPETNRVEVNISRIRSKLHRFKLSWLVVTGSDGGYRLDPDAFIQHACQDDDPIGQSANDTQALDSYLRFGNEGKAPTTTPVTSGEEHAISGKRPSLDQSG
jgi:DNA-binding winged helix-turn-helix (wHTH) protein